MIILDSGHMFKLANLDGEVENIVQFVKREGPRYPGNVGHHPGTTMQEMLRVCISRAKYANNQIRCDETTYGVEHMRQAIRWFEERAARLHGRTLSGIIFPIENETTCPKCGHIHCDGGCRK